MLSSFSYFKDEKTKDDNFSSSKHDIMYVIHRMREICRRKTREISKGVEYECTNSSFASATRYCHYLLLWSVGTCFAFPSDDVWAF